MAWTGRQLGQRRCTSRDATAYSSGRGTGLGFQDDRRVQTDFGLVCTSPRTATVKLDVNAQTVLSTDIATTGGYDPIRGGEAPWNEHANGNYLLGLDRERPHAVTDSAASATSMTSGIKTYNAGDQRLGRWNASGADRTAACRRTKTSRSASSQCSGLTRHTGSRLRQQRDTQGLSGHGPRHARLAVLIPSQRAASWSRRADRRWMGRRR